MLFENYVYIIAFLKVGGGANVGLKSITEVPN